MNCTECIEKLVEYVEGLLPDEQKQQLELHLKNCRQCQAELDKLIALGDRITSDSKSKQLTDFEYAVFNRIIREQNKRLKRADGINRQFEIWRIIMKSKITKLAVAAVLLVAAVMSITLLNKSATPAYALQQTIEALRNFGAVHMIGTTTLGGGFKGQQKGYEMWMEASKSKNSSQDAVLYITNGIIQWVKDGNTYTYVPQNNTVYYENAITLGAQPWIGPAWLEWLGKKDSTKVLQGKDPATGRDRITLLASITDSFGPKSLIIEFDGETKLPIAMKLWTNPDRSGQPHFEAFKITYYQEMPDNLLNVQIPGDPNYEEKPPTIAEENIGLLTNPDDGISSQGLTQQDACRKILREFFEATIDGKLEQMKKLSPLLKSSNDEALRYVVEDFQVAEILEDGRICKTGNSKLGPIAAASIIVKHKDGTKTEEKMIVQFRNIEGKESCVVYPYSCSRDIE